MLDDLPRPIAILGAGISGQSIFRLLRETGIEESEITFLDQKKDKAPFQDAEELLKKFAPKTLVVSPGVPLSTPWINSFDGLITSELSLAALFLQQEKVIGVTGSLGKSTVVSLLGAALESAQIPSFVGGNLGFPLADYVVDVLQKKRERAEWIVLELSSFQLENLESLRFESALITYLSQNHLERYESLEAYYETKWNLVKKTSGNLVMNKNGGDLWNYASKQTEQARLHWTSRDVSNLSPADFAASALVGLHNRDNLAMAAEMAELCHWPKSFKKGLLEFSGLPHRVQNLGIFHGLRFINDSKATTMESVLTATESVLPEITGTLWLMLGGRDKKLPWQQLHTLSGKSGLSCVFFGECAALAQKVSGLSGPQFPKLSEALSWIRSKAKSGDTILLSPGGSSLDEFKNFEDRGKAFEALARHTQ